MIIKGYKGIMDLDLSSIDPKFHKEVILQHKEDIQNYKRDQCERPSRLRYETAMVKAFNTLQTDRKALEKRRIAEQEKLDQKYKEREQIFYKIQEQKKHGCL